MADQKKKMARIDQADFAIVLGGDGTVLRAAREVSLLGIPLLGINTGTLGFLSGSELKDFRRRLDAVIKGKYSIENRTMINVEIFRKGRRIFGPELALNECTIRYGEHSRAITLATYLGKKFITNYYGDGLIVATPTGSTAYALAAAGPIVDPSLEVTILAPICPHMLTQRPLIVPAHLPLHIHLVLRPDDRRTQAFVSIDGRPGCELKMGDDVKIERAQIPLHLLLPPGQFYFDVLRRKLKWGQR